MLKVIKSKPDYAAALATVDRLIALDPEPGTDEGNELEVLSLLIRDYEKSRYPTELPDPIEAIRFRMDQMGLSHRDLVPFIGSRGRVSEVLARKRSLTLAMMKSLHSGLGIPASVLLRDERRADDSGWESELSRFPVRELIRRRWIEVSPRAPREEFWPRLRQFLAPVTEATYRIQGLTRMTWNQRADRPNDRYALMAWTARALQVARSWDLQGSFSTGGMTSEALRGLVHLSVLDDGPLKAREYLSRYGIALAVVPHLPGTRLDGAVLLESPDRPVIALTLRYDRVDSFWFTLFHELGHLLRHVEDGHADFIDDLEAAASDPREAEADEFARDTLIPRTAWERSCLHGMPNPTEVRVLARELGVHPGIVAGRVRRECGDYRRLNNLVGAGKVRRLFPGEFDEAEA